MTERIVYFNGDWVPESEARVSILDRGFQGGEGVYDVGRTYGHEPFRLRRHVDRLFRSLRYTRIADRGDARPRWRASRARS